MAWYSQKIRPAVQCHIFLNKPCRNWTLTLCTYGLQAASILYVSLRVLKYVQTFANRTSMAIMICHPCLNLSSKSVKRKCKGCETVLSINHLFTLACMSCLQSSRWQVFLFFVLLCFATNCFDQRKWATRPGCSSFWKTLQSAPPSVCLFWNKNKINRSDVLFIFSHSHPLLPIMSRVVKKNSLIISQYQSKVCV